MPKDYTLAFVNLQGATQGRGYLTYKTLTAYDPSACTAACDKLRDCVFANIYYEKDPDKNNNPIDVIKCSLYSMFQTSATATNKGQWRGKFQVLVTGSNGYVRVSMSTRITVLIHARYNKAAVPVAPAGYALESLPAAVNAPILDKQGQGRLIQPVYLDIYSPALCAAACDKQTQWDKSQAPGSCDYKTCVYANLYILNKGGAPQTVVCALYTETTDASAATNKVRNIVDSFSLRSADIFVRDTLAKMASCIKCPIQSHSSIQDYKRPDIRSLVLRLHKRLPVYRT
jgi:hypothetical protein